MIKDADGFFRDAFLIKAYYEELYPVTEAFKLATEFVEAAGLHPRQITERQAHRIIAEARNDATYAAQVANFDGLRRGCLEVLKLSPEKQESAKRLFASETADELRKVFYAGQLAKWDRLTRLNRRGGEVVVTE